MFGQVRLHTDQFCAVTVSFHIDACLREHGELYGVDPGLL